MSQVKSLYYIVQQCQADLDMQNTKHSMRFMQWAINGYREMNKANVIQNTIKSTTLILDEHREAILPSDYYDYVRIGVCIQGYIINYDRNDTICHERRREPCTDDEVCCTLDNIWANPQGWWLGNYWQWGWMPYNHNGTFNAGYYGKGEGFYHGGYVIDEERGIIKFDKRVKCDFVLLEYQSSGGIEEGNAYIPDICIEALRHYVHWQRCMFSRDPAERNNQETHRKRYQREVKRIVAKVNSLTMHQILSEFRASIHQLPKR